MERTSHVIPMQLQVRFTLRPAELHIFRSTREQRHFHLKQTSVGVEGQNADTHLQDGWF